MSNLTDRATVRELLGIASGATGEDARIDLLIPMVSGMVERICDRIFTRAVVTEYPTGRGGDSVPLKRWPVNEVRTVRLSTSTPRDYTEEVLTVGTDVIWDEERALLVRIDGGVFYEGARAIEVVYDGGYDFPRSVANATERITNGSFEAWDSDTLPTGWTKNVNSGGGDVSRFADSMLGTYCARMTRTVTSAYLDLTQAGITGLVPGGRYDWSIWMRTSAAAVSQAACYFRNNTANKGIQTSTGLWVTSGAGDTILPSFTSPSNQWFQRGGTFTVDPSFSLTDSYRIWLICTGTGSTWTQFEGVSISGPVSWDVPNPLPYDLEHAIAQIIGVHLDKGGGRQYGRQSVSVGEGQTIRYAEDDIPKGALEILLRYKRPIA